MTSSSFHGLQFPFHGEEIEVVRGSSIGGGVHPCTKECDKINKSD